MEIIASLDSVTLAVLIDAIGKIDRERFDAMGVWSVQTTAYTMGYWHKEWQFGNDGKAYYVKD